MPRKIRQLKADLRKAGAYQVSQESSHTKWKHPLIPANTLILSGHDGDDAKPYQEKTVHDLLRQIAQAKRSSGL
ncbi:MAG: type II toxin-antitoxin system HicA family toxin [Chloroflexi bacterium]|nr:type II toxin-antitoxin system HicA family toxin [Chloroflexota bacterium]